MVRHLTRTLILLFALAWPYAEATAERRCGRNATLIEAQALAEKAAQRLKEVGVSRAFGEFFDPKGGFQSHDLYVFVFRRDGLMLLNAGFPELIGSNVLAAGTSDSRSFGAEALRLTKNGGAGWITYNWYNPCTGNVMPKSSYVIGQGDLIIGVGAYGAITT